MKPYTKREKENVNGGIRFKELRVVFPDGQTRVMATPDAIEAAKNLGLDVVVVSPTVVPPVAKLIEYGQLLYENKKKRKQVKKSQHIQLLKELKFRPGTEDHDYDFKRKHAQEWLTEGHKVKAVVAFRGREITHANLGKDLLKRLVADLAQYGTVEGAEPRFEGKQAHLIISPIKLK